MNIENRLKLFNAEKAKILGFGRSHLRDVDSARKLAGDVEKKVRKEKKDFAAAQSFQFWLWETVKARCDELKKRDQFQFRVFDEGTIEFLDQNLIKRPSESIGEQLDAVREMLGMMPEKARSFLFSHYRRGRSCDQIASEIGIPMDEVYRIWQHSMIFLWETSHQEEVHGILGPEDEAFWTQALHYLDGSASEKFAAELNSEIHINRTRTKQYNDLRIIDGIMIEMGQHENWPGLSEDDIKHSSGKSSGENLKQAHGAPGANQSDGLRPEEKQVPVSTRVKSMLAGTLSLLGRQAQAARTAIERLFRRRETSPSESRGDLITADPEKVSSQGDPVLVSARMDEGTRHGVHFDDRPLLKRIRWNSAVMRRIAIGTLTVVAIALMARMIGSMIPEIEPDHSVRILRTAGAEMAERSIRSGDRLDPGRYLLERGAFEFLTPGGSICIVEGPAGFELDSGDTISLNSGRLVTSVPSGLDGSFTIQTNRFKFVAREGSTGVIHRQDYTDLLVFSGTGEAHFDSITSQIDEGRGLRFHEVGKPEPVIPRDEAHRFPEILPSASPRLMGDNLVLNHSFEVGILSRSCKTERLYRDIPLGWKAGWQRDGEWTEAMEQYSGTVRITDAIGGLPAPGDGERYLWINHGFITQELEGLEPGGRYELVVGIASHRDLGPGSGKMFKHVGGNAFRFGIWTGERWLAEASGQLEAGQPFQEMKLNFKFPSDIPEGERPVLMLTGETRIFYDNVILRNINSKRPPLAPEQSLRSR